MATRILVESGIDKGMEFPIPEGESMLGRSAANAFQIIDKRMSRHHIQFDRRGVRLTVRDLDSKNGTYLNNQRVVGTLELRHNDRIRIGETVLLIEKDDDEGAAAASHTSNVKFQEESWTDNAARSNTMVAGVPQMELKQFVAKQDKSAPARDDRNQQSEILLAVADAIRTILNFDELLERIMDIIWNSLDPDTGVLFLVDERTNQLYPVVSRRGIREPGKPSTWEVPEEGIAVSRSIITRAMNDRVCILMADQEDSRFHESESVILHKINAALCSPLIVKDEILGVVYIDSGSKFSAWTTDQQSLLTGIANQAAMAISNVRLHTKLVAQEKLEREMEIARTIQQNLLPKSLPEMANFELAGMSLSAKHVGGDYYDFVRLSDGRWGLAVADVSGKGVPASLLTTTVRASMLAFARDAEQTPPEMMTLLNGVTHRDSLNNMFVTMIYAIIDDNGRTIGYTNAGHAHPLIFWPDGGETALIQGGCFLGIDSEMTYEMGTERMVSGAVAVFYTDGVPDSTNEQNQQFGVERLRAVVRENMTRSAQEILDAVYQATLSYRGTAPQFDDFTLIVCKCVQ